MMLAAVPMSMTIAAHLALAAAVGIARFTSIKLPHCSQGRKAYATPIIMSAAAPRYEGTESR